MFQGIKVRLKRRGVFLEPVLLEIHLKIRKVVFLIGQVLFFGLVGAVISSSFAETNLISNYSFEEKADSDFPRRSFYGYTNIPLNTWAFTYNVKRIETDAHSGIKSVELTDTSTVNGEAVFQIIPISPNTRYNLTAWGKKDSVKPASNAFILMYFLTSSKGKTGSDTYKYGFTPGQWTQMSISTTSPSKAAYVKVVVGIGTSGTGILYADDAVLVVVDTTPPEGTIKINNDAAYTNSTTVTLTLSATDSESGMGSGAQMQFSNDNVTWSTPEAYATTKLWTLTSGDGTKTVYVKYKDVAGNWSSPVWDTIILDTANPTVTITEPKDGAIITDQ